MPHDIVCDGPGPHVPASGAIGTIERPAPPRPGEFRCDGVNCRPPPQTVEQQDDRSAEDFIRARIPGAVDKAKQIMAAPGATWTAAETRVILAALVLDLAARRTR